MGKMEKLIVSADPETKQLIEEIQDAIADTIENKLDEILSKKISNLKIDSSKINIDLSSITNRLDKIEQTINKSSVIQTSEVKNSLSYTPKKNYPRFLYLISKRGNIFLTLLNDGNGKYTGGLWNKDIIEYYIKDSDGNTYGYNNSTRLLIKGGMNLITLSVHQYHNFDINLNTMKLIV